MTTLTAGCKVNLGLRITGRLADGYHSLDSVFYPLVIPCDQMVITENGDGIAVECDDARIDTRDNTLTRAYTLFQQAAGRTPPGIHVRLHKGIPVGAGLGGGSSDAACLLRWLNERLENPLGQKALASTALRIGADTPFFLTNTPSRVRGVGEQIHPISHNFSDVLMLLVCPDIHVSTAAAYRDYDALIRSRQGELPEEGLTNAGTASNDSFSADGTPPPWSVWNIRNDLEAAVFPRYPELADIKANLQLHGAGAVCMSGSGSAIFGLFRSGERALAEKAARALHDGKRRIYQLPLGVGM